ncbi:MAG: hypothetical protein Q9161_001644 [Pseudevernia consocians]
MLSADLTIAIVALLISVIVGLVIGFQLRAQIYSTAEGQRKCSSSLLGLWSEDSTTATYRKLRWSQFRYEIKFVVPEICLGNPVSEIEDKSDDVPNKSRSRIWNRFRSNPKTQKRIKRKTESILGADPDLDYVLFGSAVAEDAPDMVSWLSFLTFLRLEIEDAKMESSEDNHESATTSPSPQDDHESATKSLSPQDDHKSASKLLPLEISWPRIKYRVHSWDFMPPDAPKPFAKITLHDIAVLVRRTGMIWKVFDPKNGNMSAEGGAHILTSTTIQGIGLVLEYRCLDDNQLARGSRTKIRDATKDGHHALSKSPWNALRKKADALGLDPPHTLKTDEESRGSENLPADLPDERNRKARTLGSWVTAMDKLVFGLIPRDPRLDLPDLPFAESSDRPKALSKLGFESTGVFKEFVDPLEYRFQFNEMMCMAPPVLMRDGGKTVLPVKPSELVSLFMFRDSLFSFQTLLRRYLNGVGDTLKPREDGGTDQMKRVLEGVQDIIMNSENSENIRTLRFRKKMRDDHDSTTRYFISKKDELRFHDIFRAHFSEVPLVKSPANAFMGVMESYFSYIPHYVLFMEREKSLSCGESSGCANKDLVIEAWFTLMWRGFLFFWLHNHHFRDLEGIYVPHEYYGSRLPVYLI